MAREDERRLTRRTENGGPGPLSKMKGLHLANQSTCPANVFGTSSIGEKAEVANPYKPVWQNVHQKAAQKLHGIERDDFGLISICIAAPAECNFPAVKG